MWVSLDDEWILGGIGVKGDTADDSRVGDLLAVLLGLDGRVEQIPQQCQAEAEQQTEHHAEGQVARRLGADRRGGDGGGTHDGHLHRAGLAFGHTLQVCDGLGELNGVWLRCSDVMLPWVGRRRGNGIRGRVVVLGPGATSSSSGSRRCCGVLVA